MKIFLIMMSCIVVISTIVAVIFYHISSKNKSKSDKNKSENNLSNSNQIIENKINEKYIKDKYGKTIDLLRGMSETKDITTGIVFINIDNATDIKLPYECLSPIKTHNDEDYLFVLDIDRHQYDQYIISDAYGKLSLYRMSSVVNLFRSSEYERYDERIEDHDYHFLTIGSDITNYKLGEDLSDLNYSNTKSRITMDDLIMKHALSSDALVGFYESLIKMKQLSYDEMISELIKFEKSLEQMERVDLVNNNEKINKLIEEYGLHESNQKNNITQIDKDLRKLTRK